MRRDDERLTDMLVAADKIADRVRQGRQRFDELEDLQIVLVHLVQVIGEAATGLSDEVLTTHPEVPWRQIVAMRNRVVHGYFEVDLDVLWDVVTLDVPRLAMQIEGVLGNGR